MFHIVEKWCRGLLFPRYVADVPCCVQTISGIGDDRWWSISIWVGGNSTLVHIGVLSHLGCGCIDIIFGNVSWFVHIVTVDRGPATIRLTHAPILFGHQRRGNGLPLCKSSSIAVAKKSPSEAVRRDAERHRQQARCPQWIDCRTARRSRCLLRGQHHVSLGKCEFGHMLKNTGS